MELKRLKMKKHYEQKMTELKEFDEDENLTELKSRSDNIKLPRETKEESIQRFFESQPLDEVKVKISAAVVPEGSQDNPERGAKLRHLERKRLQSPLLMWQT